MTDAVISLLLPAAARALCAAAIAQRRSTLEQPCPQLCVPCLADARTVLEAVLPLCLAVADRRERVTGRMLAEAQTAADICATQVRQLAERIAELEAVEADAAAASIAGAMLRTET